MTHTCENKDCQNVAAHALVTIKDKKEFRFYGCKEHFMDVCSHYMNHGGYVFKGTEVVQSSGEV